YSATDRERAATTRDYILGYRDQIATCCASQSTVPTRQPPWGEGGLGNPLIAPFGENPEVLADWLIVELRNRWWREPPQERFACRPVILPVPLASMEGDIANLPPAVRLACAIRRRLGTDAPTAEHLEVALRRPGKLVLVVYPLPSLNWWE